MTPEQIQTINTIALYNPIVAQIVRLFRNSSDMNLSDSLYMMVVELDKENKELKKLLTEINMTRPLMAYNTLKPGAITVVESEGNKIIHKMFIFFFIIALLSFCGFVFMSLMFS